LFQRTEVIPPFGMDLKSTQRFLESLWMDIFGVTLILTVSFALGFHETKVNGLPMVTRLVTKRNNLGNFIGLFTAVNSAVVDYYLGNEAAFLTYPISFLGAGVSYLYWKRIPKRIPRKIDYIYAVNIAIAFALGFVLNYIGFTDFLSEPVGEKRSKFLITALITGITYSGILNTPRMYADTWASWQVYNGLKLYQNILFGNVAFVAKYIFYFFNAGLAWLVWHFIRRSADESLEGPRT
jgi:hypothetical protein